jgi:protease PrsW
VQVISPLLGERLSGGGLIAAGIVLALVPAVVWMAVFYVQDRLEPEPVGYVIEMMLLGGILASGVGQPLIEGVFKVREWGDEGLLVKLGAGILVVGIIQEFLKYGAVRYGIYFSAEFDERLDGIVYGAAVGLGYATMLNLSYVIGSGGVQLGIGATRMVVEALAQASFAGVSGYFLGRAKFENKGKYWLPLGVLLASVLNGVVSVGLGEVSRTGLKVTAVNGLALSAVVAVICFGVLYLLMKRETERELKAAG